MRSNPSKQFLSLKRLADVVNRANSQPFHSLLDIARRRDEDYRNSLGLVVRFKPTAHLEPVEVWHTNVQQDEFRQQNIDRCERQPAAIGRTHTISFWRQDT